MAMPYCVEYARSGQSKCKKSKVKIEKGELRIGKQTPSPYGEEGDMMYQWYKVAPFFEFMFKMRKDTAKPETIEDFMGFENIEEADLETIKSKLQDFYDRKVTMTAAPKKKRPKKTVKVEEDAAAAEDDEDDEGSKPSKKKAKASPEKKVKVEKHVSQVVPFDKATSKELAASLVAQAREDQIKMPTDDSEARQRAGAVIISTMNRAEGTVDIGQCLDELQSQFGTKKGEKLVEVAVEANRALHDAFLEMSGFEFKAKQQMKGIAYRKVATALQNAVDEITSGKMASKLDGIGKSSAAKIDEFLEGGTIAKLEEYRSGVLG